MHLILIESRLNALQFLFVFLLMIFDSTFQFHSTESMIRWLRAGLIKPDDVTPWTRSRQDEYSPFLHGRIGLLIFKNCQSRQTPAVLCRRDCQDKRKSHVFRFLGLIKRPIH